MVTQTSVILAQVIAYCLTATKAWANVTNLSSNIFCIIHLKIISHEMFINLTHGELGGNIKVTTNVLDNRKKQLHFIVSWSWTYYNSDYISWHRYKCHTVLPIWYYLHKRLKHIDQGPFYIHYMPWCHLLLVPFSTVYMNFEQIALSGTLSVCQSL